MKKAFRTAVVYALVSAFAIVLNIGAQAFSMWIYRGVYDVELSVLAGTLIGFPVKYLLEKKYVFEFRVDNLSHDACLFISYGFMGVFTTAIFWGIEFFFQYLYGTDSMRYLGGVVGLTFGSYLKYHLDKLFVFKRERE
jgi:putative flippase GtrA